MRNALNGVWCGLMAVALAGCGAGSSGGAGAIGARTKAGSSDAAGLTVRLAAEQRTSGNQVLDMEHIFVSVSGVAAHAAGSGWQAVSDTPVVVDLLRLGDSADALGFARLPEGRITQIRLYVADDGQSHAINSEGDDRVLVVPSGFQTGVKLHGPFDLGACEHGQLTAVLDLEKSILIHGNGNHDDWMLRPTIHRTDYTTSPAQCDDGEVPGDDEPGDDQPGDDQPGDDQPGDDEPGDDEPGSCEPGTEGCDTGGDDTGGDDTGGTGGDDTGDGGTGDDAGDACAPVVDDNGALVDPCTGETISIG